MSSRRSETLIFSALVVAGGLLYALRWELFPAPALHNEMWRFLVGDIGFLFLQVAIVTMLIDRRMLTRLDGSRKEGAVRPKKATRTTTATTVPQL